MTLFLCDEHLPPRIWQSLHLEADQKQKGKTFVLLSQLDCPVVDRFCLRPQNLGPSSDEFPSEPYPIARAFVDGITGPSGSSSPPSDSLISQSQHHMKSVREPCRSYRCSLSQQCWL